MRFNHKTWAVLVIVFGLTIVISYGLGLNHGDSDGLDAQTAANKNGVTGQSVKTVVSSQAEMPTNHPTSEDSNSAVPMVAGTDARFTHFRVGSRNVKSLFIDGDDVWIGTSGGVIRYNTQKDTHQVYDNKTAGILSNGVFHVSKLGDKILAGTYGGGLSVLNPATNLWKNYNIPQGLADQFVYEVTEATNGDVWIATWSGANRIKGGDLDDADQWQTYTVENTDGGLPNRWVYGIEEGLNGDIWFATEDGLALLRQGQWQNWRHKEGLGAPYELVRDAIKFTSDPSKQSKHHARQKSKQGLENVKGAYNPNYIISLVVDGDGIVWCGTWGGGLARFDGTTWKNYTTEDGLPANHIFMLYLDPDGYLWAGTNQGLARMNKTDDHFTVMTMADGLFADNVFSMRKTADNTLWVGSFGGVARISAVN